ncbi:hemolysin family protein [Bacillus marasmi]|uniref:hemolysin family protein n=1 Tax=Bacillus marasmi TaxID=1926279 RepID=UPI0011CBE930|nr:hemolysin family protein [Bacillus marasmi]
MGAEVIILIVLILINAFFAASEMALVSLNDNKIKLMSDGGDKRAKLVLNLLSEPSRFLATIQIGITLAGFLASAFAAGSFASSFAEVLADLGIPLDEAALETISTIIITLILSYFTLVLGELVPKRLALQKAEAISFVSVMPLTWLSKLTAPFVKFLTMSTNLVVRLFGVDPNSHDEEVTEEEIRMMVDAGKEKGTIQATEKEMINNIFEFDNKTVSDIMTHRINIVGIPVDTDLPGVLKLVNCEKYTRFPVYEENIDQIIGIIHMKDLLQFIESGNAGNFKLRSLLREPYYVLESIRIDFLFKDMQKNKVHMAIVLDEYGGTDGIVTMEDLIEEIVGNIFDEYDDPETEIIQVEELAEGVYIMDGMTNLYEIEEILKVDFPSDDYDTLSGFLIGQLGYFPAPQERPSIEFGNITFLIEEMNERRIVKVKVIVKDE